MALAEEAHRASRLLLDADYVRVVARLDADGLASAAILAEALQRQGLHFHFSFLPTLTPEASAALRSEKHPLIVLLNLAEDAPALDGLAAEVITVDSYHHVEAQKGLSPVAPMEAVEATAAASTLVLALALSRRNSDLYPWVAAAAVAEGRHLGSLRGLDAELLSEAEEAGLLKREGGLAFEGPTVLDAVSRSLDPYLPGLTGRARAVKKFLQDHGVNAEAAPLALSPAEAERLASALALKLLAANAPASGVDGLLAARFRFAKPVADCADARTLADRLVHAALQDRPSLVVAAALGDVGAADALRILADEGRDKLLQALLRVEREAPASTERIQRLEAPALGMAAALAHLASTYLVDPARPVAVTVTAGTDLHVLLRAPRAGAATRLTLGNAVARAAAQHQGRGGGSQWSARAVVPATAKDPFFADLAGQLWGS
ncbi:MAG TPA: hypothetical protein VNZ52_03260 [Candidatus Thermoplasmatota archaeon]|nr:hypothetical protein [Candidatus Thermoplasmatota archaeon]